ncbi:hypothetical protein BOX37_29395 [Nocardia mangyaensis]|uniref:Uncharacterized protein n=1 Tax=Nocardia mangyaensis TaxID=2213200 RepID=A0A1J0VZL1_9NOCA|nr:hypothetical protein [Nocardia mangyaensis]APE37367.1 hypothetical protein BOX37_29395 [Nocardia mangyaensis]
MIDNESTPLDEVPEADRVEQQRSAFRDDDPDDPDFFAADDEMAASVAREADHADPADVIEQTIAVPFDEEFVAEEP